MKIIKYIKKARILILWGAAVGLILGIGVWLVALNDLGGRLATVGAFIVAILTPLIAFIVNNFVPHGKNKNEVTDEDDAPRNSRIIVIAALLAFVVAIAVVWTTPRVISAVENYMYYSNDIETIAPDTIATTNNRNMKDGDAATVTLPATKHRQLKISFDFKNNASVNLCSNAASLKITGPSGVVDQVHANSEQTIMLNDPSQPTKLGVQLVFEPETDPSCSLDVTVASAAYSR